MIKEGDKVVPIRKSVGKALENSAVWKRAKESGQNYLYCMGKDEYCKTGEVLCNHNNTPNTGDYFLLVDLIPYVEDNGINEQSPLYLKITVKELINLLNTGFIKEDDQIEVRRA